MTRLLRGQFPSVVWTFAYATAPQGGHGVGSPWHQCYDHDELRDKVGNLGLGRLVIKRRLLCADLPVVVWGPNHVPLWQRGDSSRTASRPGFRWPISRET